MLLLRHAQQATADQGAVRQRESVCCLAGGNGVERRFLPAQIGLGEREAAVGGADPLHRLSAMVDKRGAQAFVARHDAVKRGA